MELEQLRVRNGFDARYTYDADSLITNVASVGTGTGVPALAVSRSAIDGNVSGTTQGVVGTTQTYDPSYGELSGLSASASGNALFQTSYQRDDIGRITTLTETVQGATKTRLFGYDPEGRLTTVHDGTNNLVAQYAYDANGNRDRVLTSAGVVFPNCVGGGASNDQDQLCSYGGASYLLDANGALREKQEGGLHEDRRERNAKDGSFRPDRSGYSDGRFDR